MSKDYNIIQVNTKTENDFDFDKVLEKILQAIHFYKHELICELIEPFVDFENFYSRCLFQLINSYYAKIRQDFYNIVKKETDEDKNLVLNNLSNLKGIIRNSL